MKVVRADIFVVRLPFRFAFAHNLAKRDFSENLIVRAVISDGNRKETGWGEGIPRSYVTGESLSNSIALINEQFLPRLLDRHFHSTDELLSLLETEFVSLKLDQNPYGASWCALELAILDAYGKITNQNVATMFGGSNAQFNSFGITYGAVIPYVSKNAYLAILYFYKLFGFSTVKIKVGRSIDQDIKRLHLARRILGSSVKLRVDANCAWTVSQTVQAAKRMDEINILSIEQPIAADDLKGLKTISSSISQEVVVDESLCTITQARQLAEERVCSGFNIRISKVGGILAAKKIATIARDAGINVHLGAQVGESGILSAAARIFASCEPPFANYEGSNNLFLLKQDITRENLNVGPGGFGKLLKGPGLGVTVLPKRTESMRVYLNEPVLKPIS